MSECWWLKRESGTNSVRMFVKPNESGAEDKGLVELLMQGINGGKINVGQYVAHFLRINIALY